MFDFSELSQMGYTGAAERGNHFWFYTNTAEDDLTGANFMDDASAVLREGDLIYSVTDREFFAVDAINAETGVVTIVAVNGV